MSLAPSQRTQVQAFLGGGGVRQPPSLTPQQIAQQQFQVQNQAISEARRVAGNEQVLREKQARSQASGKAFLKERAEARKSILGLVQQNQGRQEARNFQQRMERAVRLGERIPVPEGMPIDFKDQAELDKLRGAGFDVPKRANQPAPLGVSVPSGAFEVDRVAQGNNVQDVIERKPRPTRRTPQPEPEPQSRDNALARTRTGGASGGLTPEVEQQFDDLVASRGQTNPFGNVGLASQRGLPQQRSAPVGVGSGLTEAQKQKDAELIAQLEAEPRSSPRGRGK